MTYDDKKDLAHPLAISLFAAIFFTYGFFATFKFVFGLLIIPCGLSTFFLARMIFVTPADEDIKLANDLKETK